MRRMACILIVGFVFALPAAGQDKIFRNVAPDKLEKILDEMDIKYQKSTGKKDDIFIYDFPRGTFKVRLYNYSGQDLWIESTFTDAVSLEDVNTWNRRAKFSRAVLLQGTGKSTVSLESQFDCLGGTSNAIIRQFVRRFDGELRDFDKFLTK